MPEKKIKKSKFVFLFLRIAVVVGGIVWAVLLVRQGQRWDELRAAFSQKNVKILFAATVGIFTIAHMIIGSRWWLLLRSQDIFIPFWAAVRLYFLGWFYNNFLPSSVGGDLIRAWYVTHHTEKKFEAVLSVFVDRAIGLLSTLVIAVFFYMLFMRGQGLRIDTGGEGGLLARVAGYKWIILLVIGIAAGVLAGFSLHSSGRAILKKFWLRVCARGINMLGKLKEAIVLYCRRPLAILTVFGMTVFMQIMTITGFWFLGRSMGVDVSVKYYYVFFTLTWVLGTLPVSIGGAVVMEGILTYMFVEFAGVEWGAAFALALCQRIIWMITSLPGAAIHLTGTHLPKDFSIDYNNPIT